VAIVHKDQVEHINSFTKLGQKYQRD